MTTGNTNITGTVNLFSGTNTYISGNTINITSTVETVVEGTSFNGNTSLADGNINMIGTTSISGITKINGPLILTCTIVFPTR